MSTPSARRPSGFPLLRLCLGLALAPVGLTATPQSTLDLLYATQHYREVALSPDGIRLAWVEERPNADRTPSRHTALFVLDGPGAAPRRVTAGDGARLGAETDPVWSPDGRQLAFLSDAAHDGQAQLCVGPAAGGAVRTLTRLDGQTTRPRWSPDGRTIALLHIAGSHAPAGAVEAAPRDSGEIAVQVDEQRLVLVDVAGGTTRSVTPEDTYVYEYDWSPDSRQLAYTAARGSGDNNWWIARLYAVAAGGGAPREIFRPATQIAVPRWSPDGGAIAFIQGLMSDQGLTGGDLWLVPAAGGAARNLTPGRHASPAWLRWTGPGRLLFTEWRQGGTAVERLDVPTGRTEPVWQGDESIEAGGDILSLSLADDGVTSAVIRSSFARPPEVWAGPTGRWGQVTHANDQRQAPWGRAEKITWTNEGQSVQGWLLRPAQVDPAKKYPLIVSVHGGPAGQLTPRWPRAAFNLTMMAAEGYFVFFPNPRGSFGQGEAFTAGNVRDFGLGDLRDILTGLDAVLPAEPVDGQRGGRGGGRDRGDKTK
jgi:dipeptidyl aminopeptidase/acylaminoacyl peptidase